MAREHDGRQERGADDDRADDRAEDRADDRVLPDVEDDLDEESYRRLAQQRRTRLVRQRVVFAVVVALVLAVGGGAYLVWSDRWQPGGRATPSAAPTSTCTPAPAPPVLAPGEVTLDVLNGTDRRGLAAAVAGELRTRGFVVAAVGNAPTPTGPGTALVTYPPAALAQAVTVGARLPGAQLVEDPAATTVTVSLGDGYQALLGEGALAPPVPPGTPPGC